MRRALATYRERIGRPAAVLQELGQRLPCLEVIEQRRERHAGADEHGRAAHDLRVTVNDRLGLLHLARPLVGDHRPGQFIAAPAEGCGGLNRKSFSNLSSPSKPLK